MAPEYRVTYQRLGPRGGWHSPNSETFSTKSAAVARYKALTQESVRWVIVEAVTAIVEWNKGA